MDDLPDKVGVYAFFQRDSRQCIYVGKTEKQSIRKRVKQHWTKATSGSLTKSELEKWIKIFHERLEIAYVPMEGEKLHCVDSLETRLIQLWEPETNINKKQPKKQKEQNHGHDCCRNEG